MSTKTNKTERVVIRFSPDVKALIQRAAEIGDNSIASFIRTAAFQAAEKAMGRINLRRWKTARMLEAHRSKMAWNSMAEYEESLTKAGPQRTVDVMNAQMGEKQAKEDLKAVSYT